VLVEVQLQIDRSKAFTWPLYLAAARARHKCEACLLVLTTDAQVAAWASEPILLGPGGPVFSPVVVGPGDIPLPSEAASAELWMLGALAHGPSDDAVIDGAVEAIARARPPHGAAFLEMLRYHLGDAFERALERVMATHEHLYLSDYARKIFDDGRAEGQARAVLRVLSARGLHVAEELRDRVLACADPAQLDVWLERAARATQIDEVFAE
jgi:hypothetical protein